MEGEMPIQHRTMCRLRRNSMSLRIVAGLLGLVLMTTPSVVLAEGITLKVFGGSSLDQLPPRAPPGEQKTIQKEVFDGFLKAKPGVSAIEWDAQGPQSDAIQRLMTARPPTRRWTSSPARPSTPMAPTSVANW